MKSYAQMEAEYGNDPDFNVREEPEEAEPEELPDQPEASFTEEELA